jgi:quercetin 2,3-dioxygenase
MSAGSGIYHSEFNVSEEDPLRFLQIWIKPNINGGEPRYQQKAFPQTKGLVDIVTPDGQNDTLQVKQDAYLRQLIVPVNEDYRLEINESRAYYLHLITGDIQINDIDLSAGDGIKISKQTLIEIHSNGEVAAKALVFDLP